MAGADESADLVARARGGDGPAWEALVARHHAGLRFFVRARLGRALARRVDAEDVAQEAWLRAIGGLSSFDARVPGAFGRWIRTLAAHALADAARAARAARRDGAREVRLDRSSWRTSRGAGESALADRTAGPATRAARAERQRALEEAFAALSPAHRRVIRLRQFEGLPAREAAVRLGSTEGAVHAQYRRALQAWAEAAEARGAAPTR